jgi:membrane fusion protein (multidrug efflux system)
MLKEKIQKFAGITISVVLLVSIGLYLKLKYIKTTDNAYIQSDITSVSSQVNGYITEVLISDNTRVNEGDIILKIDDKEYKAHVAEAEAAVAAQTAAVDINEKKVALQRALIEQAEAEIKASDADAMRATQEFDRVKSLAKEDFASRKMFDNASADTKKSKALVDKANAELEAQKRQLTVLEIEYKVETAKLKKTEAELIIARDNLDNTIITSPINGIVANRFAQVGSYARVGAPLFSVVPPANESYIVANFKETQIDNLNKGQKVKIELDAFPRLKLKGRVDSIAPATGSLFSLLPPENATGNFTKVVQRVPVKIYVTSKEKDKSKLLPGLSAKVSVYTWRK